MREPLHITAEDAHLFEMAAQIEGKTIQQFVLDSAVECARRVLMLDVDHDKLAHVEGLLREAHDRLGGYSGEAYHEVEALRARIREVLGS